MQIATIGPWEFEMPENWRHKPNESSDSYFENQEGTKGLYVKAIRVPEPEPSATQLAEHIQSVHQTGFSEGTTNAWEVVNRQVITEGALARSSLDLLDAAANYRVLSLVLATASEAIQVSIHDYLCEDYESSRGEFAGLEASIVKVASAA